MSRGGRAWGLLRDWRDHPPGCTAEHGWADGYDGPCIDDPDDVLDMIRIIDPWFAVENRQAAYREGAADERARLVWWLRAGLGGPAGTNLTAGEAELLGQLADVIADHPERFADAPPGLPDWWTGHEAVMTINESAPEPTEPATTEVSVETPAKVTSTTEVDAVPETAGPAVPDAVTDAMEVEPKEG